MSVADITTIITTVGFPIVMCGAMAWYVKYSTDESNKRIDALNENHKAEVTSIKDALNNNTLVLQKLIDKLDS